MSGVKEQGAKEEDLLRDPHKTWVEGKRERDEDEEEEEEEKERNRRR